MTRAEMIQKIAEAIRVAGDYRAKPNGPFMKILAEAALKACEDSGMVLGEVKKIFVDENVFYERLVKSEWEDEK